MSRPAERRRAGARRWPRAVAAALAALVLCFVLAATIGRAQDGPSAPPPEWAETLSAAEALAADEDAATAELQVQRDALLRLRSAAIEFEAASQALVADANARLTTLGPAPADGATEPPELAQRRAAIGEELAAVQVPVLEAQDAQRRADTLIRDIDRVVRGRFLAELRSNGPSPLRPSLWLAAARDLAGHFRSTEETVAARLADPVIRAQLAQRLPLDLLLAAGGIVFAFVLRRRLVWWSESRLARAGTPRAIALLVTLRNIAKLILPAVGAGMLYAALSPAALMQPDAAPRVFALPDFLLAFIAASWLAGSVFAPKLAAYRLAPLDDAEAALGARVTLAFGVVIGLHLFLTRYLLGTELSAATASVTLFPLFVAGGLLLWLASRLLRSVRRQIDARDKAAGAERRAVIGLAALEAAQRGAFVVAFVAPLLAALGYLAAASHLMIAAILTLGLAGVGLVLFDLATVTLGAFGDRKGERAGDFGRDGLVPVLVAAVLSLAAIPPLMLIWGARASDLADVWYMLRDGVTFGGMRISFGMIVSFALVFGVIFGLSRLLQSVLRNSVLPRTRMDAGGKNAVLAGVGYIGFFVAAIVAVSSTGLDLSSLAFVAGALSVGIGFGLQNVVSNFVSGIILLVERPIKEGDWIEVGGHAGYVRGISVRSTEIETFDRASVILPNSDLVAGTVLNRTHSGMSGRIIVTVGVDMDSDARRVEDILLAAAEEHPLVLKAPSPRVLLMDLGPDTLMFELRCWLRDVNFSLTARSDLNFEILEGLRAAGVQLQPYLRDARTPPEPPAASAPEAAEEPPKAVAKRS